MKDKIKLHGDSDLYRIEELLLKALILLLYFCFMRTALTGYFLLLTTYFFSQGAWTQKASLIGAGRYETASFSIGNKGYIGTGRGLANSFLKDFWEWDQTTNVWTQKADFGGIERWDAIGFSVNGKGYIGTGYWDDGINSLLLSDFWEYDPFANSWVQKANFGGGPRSLATSFVIGNKAYVGTGWNNTAKNDFWEYDPSNDTWTQITTFGGCGRGPAVAFSIGNFGYVGTGNDTINSPSSDFWKYDLLNNIWTPVASFPDTRCAGVGFAIGTKGYLATGIDSTNTFKKDCWQYDPNTNTWSQETSFGGLARFYAVGFTIGLKGYIGFGMQGWDDLWEFDPNTSGVEDIQKKVSVSVYPNPMHEEATLRITNLGKLRMDDINFNLYDLQGNNITPSVTRNTESFVIHRGSFASGIYIFKVFSPGGVSASGKLIMQ